MAYLIYGRIYCISEGKNRRMRFKAQNMINFILIKNIQWNIIGSISIMFTTLVYI